MTTSLNAHRLLKAYEALAADNYGGGREAFVELADLAVACLSNATAEQRLPAMVLQNVFDALSREQGERGEVRAAGTLVPPELNAAILSALRFVVSGGSPSRCIQVSEQLIRASPIGGYGKP